jgi:hypothetical protein
MNSEQNPVFIAQLSAFILHHSIKKTEFNSVFFITLQEASLPPGFAVITTAAATTAAATTTAATAATATATATAVTATATATAAAVTATTAATTAAATFITGTRFVDIDGATIKLVSIKLFNSLCSGIIVHLHESKTSRATCTSVRYN